MALSAHVPGGKPDVPDGTYEVCFIGCEDLDPYSPVARGDLWRFRVVEGPCARREVTAVTPPTPGPGDDCPLPALLPGLKGPDNPHGWSCEPARYIGRPYRVTVEQGRVAGLAPGPGWAQAGQPPARPGAGWRYDAIDSDALARADSRPTFLVEDVLVAGQPAVLGGPLKTLKTGLAID